MDRNESIDIEGFLHKESAVTNPSPGQLIVAEPMLADANFTRSVVLILDRDKSGGHLGLVMNHETPINVDVLLDDWVGADRMPFFNGGPVELDRIFMLHRLGAIIDDSIELLPGLWTGGRLEQLREYIASGAETEGKIRFYFGYSGWAEGQLTAEILQNSWGVVPNPDINVILRGEGEQYWRREVERLGPDYRSWLSIPQHPSLN